VSVAPGGRVLEVTGSPTPDLHPNTTAPALTATQARGLAMADAGASGATPSVDHVLAGAARTTFFTDGSKAELVLLGRPQGTRLAWSLTTVAAQRAEYVYVVDAVDGGILWRQSIVHDATGLAWDSYPSTLVPGGGGVQQARDFTANGWLSSSARLSGPNAHTYADLNDDDAPGTGEEIPPTAGAWNYPVTFLTGAAPLSCDDQAPCVWNPFAASSWTTNARQTQRSCSITSIRSTTGCAATRSASRPQAATSRVTMRSRPKRSTERTGRAVCPTRTIWTTPTCPRRPTVRRHGCRCTSSRPATPGASPP
jgi:hypothetical protein